MRPPFQHQHRCRVKRFNRPQAQHRQRFCPCGQPQQISQGLRFEQRHPAHAQTFDAGGQPQVLDGAGQRRHVHFRQRPPTENVLFAVIHQGGHQHLGAIIDAFDLQRHEFIGALAQGICGAYPLLFHQALDLAPQLAVSDADKPPRLHQPHAWGLMRRFQQTRQQLGCHTATTEVAHITALGDGAVNGGAFLRAKGVIAHGTFTAHGANNAAMA